MSTISSSRGEALSSTISSISSSEYPIDAAIVSTSSWVIVGFSEIKVRTSAVPRVLLVISSTTSSLVIVGFALIISTISASVNLLVSINVWMSSWVKPPKSSNVMSSGRSSAVINSETEASINSWISSSDRVVSSGKSRLSIAVEIKALISSSERVVSAGIASIAASINPWISSSVLTWSSGKSEAVIKSETATSIVTGKLHALMRILML